MADPCSRNWNPTLGGFSALILAFLWIGIDSNCYSGIIAHAADVGKVLRNNEGPSCVSFKEKTFSLMCNFQWNTFFDDDSFIRLRENEVFNGNDHEIHLTGAEFWDGLFEIDSTVEWEDAPVIHHLHLRGGQTSEIGGFFVQVAQANFIVDSCSSSGTIKGGGICGNGCSGTILLTNCWSTGDIGGQSSGGIVGSLFGSNSGQVNITNCWSEGDISGLNCGGISGSDTGTRGFATISKCYAKGRINGLQSGGICGYHTGGNNGRVKISECYTLGEISGSGSGGITGVSTGTGNGFVEITNCYTQGSITGLDNSGGICGRTTAVDNGLVVITNVYASGNIGAPDAGGIIGASRPSGRIAVSMSVYNIGPMIGSRDGSSIQQEKNSKYLVDIKGGVHCYDEIECWNTDTIWKAMPGDGLPILQAQISPSPSSTSTQTATAIRTPTVTTTETRHAELVSTQSPCTSQTATPTLTETPPPTIIATSTSTQTSTWSSPFQTSSPLETNTLSPSRIGALTSSAIPSPPITETSTRTNRKTATLAPPSFTPFATPSQIFDIPDANDTVTINPSDFTIIVQRDAHVGVSQNFSVSIVASPGLLVSWRLSPSLFGLVIPPKSEKLLQEQMKEDGVVIIEQVFLVRTRLLPQGKTTGHAYISFSRQRETVATLTREVLVSVLEGIPRISQSVFEVVESSSKSVSHRELVLTNVGTSPIWWTSGLVQHPNVTSSVSWINIPQTGTVLAESDKIISIELHPGETGGPGVFEAWILLKTDALMGDYQNFPHEFGDNVPPVIDETVGIGFWVRIRLIVSSVFVCTTFGPLISLLPHQEKDIIVNIVNTDIHAVVVRSSNFTIRMANASTSPVIRATTSDPVYKRDLIGLIKNHIVRVTPWWQIFPSTLVIPRGMSKYVRIRISYPSPLLGLFDEVTELPPARYELRFSTEVFLGKPNSLPVSKFDNRFRISFESGDASLYRSHLLMSRTSGTIGETLRFVLVLLDEFGYGPATALLTSTADNINQPRSPPKLTITSMSPTGSVTEDLKINCGEGSSRIHGRVPFELTLRDEGHTLLDARLNNVSIDGFPFRVVATAFECRGSFEVLRANGLECFCKRGYIRDGNSNCVPCPAGTFSARSSNAERCSNCGQGFFAEEGSSSCTKCAEEGVSCTGGILLMKQGFWCELCQESLVIPRQRVVSEIRDGNQRLFHQCASAEACRVNTSSFASSCGLGYSTDSPVCSQCEEGFVKLADGKCVMCASKVREITLTVLASMLVIAMMFVVALLSHRDTSSYQGEATSSDRQYSRAESIRKVITNPLLEQKISDQETNLSDDNQNRDSIECGRDDELIAAYCMRSHSMLPTHRTLGMKSLLLDVFLNTSYNDKLRKNLVGIRHLILIGFDFLQITFILHRMDISPFSNSAGWILPISDLAALSPSQASAFQCTFSSDPSQTAILTFFVPIVILVGLALLQTLIACNNKDAKATISWKILLRSFARSSILMLGLVYMAIGRETLRVFAVYPVPIESTKRAELDLAIETDSSQYRQLQGMAIVSLLGFVIGYPCVTLLYYLRRHKQSQSSEEMWSFIKLTGEYRVNGYGFLWETIVVLRKLSLLLVTQFVEGPLSQFVYTTMILTVSLFALASILPYRKRVVNFVQYLMTYTCLSNSCFGFMMAMFLQQSASRSDTRLQQLSHAVALFQILFLLSLILAITSLTPKAAKAIQKLISKCRLYCAARKQADNETEMKSLRNDEIIHLTELPMHLRGTSAIIMDIKKRAENASKVSRPSDARMARLQRPRRHDKGKKLWTSRP